MQSLADDYMKCLPSYAHFELIETKAVSFAGSDKPRAKKLEKDGLKKVLHRFSKDSIYLLAERGRLYDSIAWVDFMGSCVSSDRALVVVGTLGWDKEYHY